MAPRKVRRSRSAPQDVEGDHSPEPSHNNVGTPILEVTIAHLIEAMKDLQENQNKVAAAVKQLQENMIVKPNTPATGQGASATQGVRAPESNVGSVLTQVDVMALLEKELHKPSTEDLKYVPQPPYPTEIFHKPYPAGYEAPHFTLFDGRKGNPKEHIN